MRRRGHQRGGLLVDVGDDAQPVALVEQARLSRNVRGGVVQPEKRLEAAARHFGDHLAGAVRMKAIDHDAVEAGQHPQLPRRLLREVGDRGGLAHPPDHQPNQFAGIDVVLDHARLRFDDEIRAGEMDGDVERLSAVLQLHAEHAFDGVLAAQIVDAGPYGRDRATRHDVADRALQQIGRLHAEIGRGIVGGDAHREVGQQGKQKSKRLDRAENVNRLAVAIGESDLLVHASVPRGIGTRTATARNRFLARPAAATAQ